MRREGISFELLADFETGGVRQMYIQDDQRRARGCLFQSFAPTGSMFTFVSRLLQDTAQDVPILLPVVDDQDAG